MSTQSIITSAVKSYMAREKLNQLALAALLESSQTAVSRKLKGIICWTMGDLDRLVVLGVIQPLTALDVTEFRE